MRRSEPKFKKESSFALPERAVSTIFHMHLCGEFVGAKVYVVSHYIKLWLQLTVIKHCFEIENARSLGKTENAKLKMQ